MLTFKISFLMAIIKYGFTPKSSQKSFSDIRKEILYTLLGAFLICLFFLIVIPLTVAFGIISFPFYFYFFRKEPFTDIYLFFWDNCKSTFQ